MNPPQLVWPLHGRDTQIPELMVAGPAIPVSVTVVLGQTPRELADCSYRGTIVQVAHGEFLFYLPGIARYHVSGGNRIVVEPEAGASELNARLYLLGGVLGALTSDSCQEDNHAKYR